MSVIRSVNFLNQMRVDVPDMRSIESSTRADFDTLLKSFALANGESYVIRGLEIYMTGAVGGSAAGLQLIVSNAAVFHGSSDVSGTFYNIPSGTANQVLNATVNDQIDGAFSPSSINYIGFEFVRAVDNSTTGQRYLWNPTTDSEISTNVPLAIILTYKIVITTSIWASNVLPIAIVQTDSSNNVLSITDQRPMLFRLGTAGYNTPNPSYEYPWTNQPEGRTENYYTSTNATSPFEGGDKQIESFKEWSNAIMTEIKLIKGTPHWFDLLPNISISDILLKTVNLEMTGRGSITHSETFAGQINWDRDFYLKTIGSRLDYRILANLTSNYITLSDTQCAYLQLNEKQAIAPSLILTNGSPTVNSVGAVSWTSDVLAGDYIKLASADESKYYQILSVDSATQITLTSNYGEASTGATGVACQYTWGVYQAVATPTTDRHIQIALKKDVPIDGSAYWLFLRDDNASAAPTVYIHTGGGMGQLIQGQSVDINNDTTDNSLVYIGSPDAGTSQPNYVGSIDAKEVTQAYLVAQSFLATGQYWLLNSASGTNYYVWYKFNGVGLDPAIPGRTGVPVNLSASGDTESQVAQKTQVAVDALADFAATVSYNVVTIQDQNNGTPADATNGNMGGAFVIKIPTEGDLSCKFNQQDYGTVEGENLTRRAARLTAMMADKAQDKTIGFLGDYQLCMRVTSGMTEELSFNNADSLGNPTTPYLYIGIPSSANNTIIDMSLGGPVVLAANQVAYVGINRNAASSINLSNLTVCSMASCPLNENTFIFAYRLGTESVWLWDGTELVEGGNASLAALTNILNTKKYEEFISIIPGVPVTAWQLQGPVLAGTNITIPPDSKNGDLQKYYTVNENNLEVYLNGQLLSIGDAWQQVGSGSSDQIEILIDLEVGDDVGFRIGTTGGMFGIPGGGGGGGISAGVNLGSGTGVYKDVSGADLEFKTLVQGANIVISSTANEVTISASGGAAKVPWWVINANYQILDADGYDVLLCTTGNTDRTITLPVSANNVGRQLVVKKVDSGSGYVKIRAINLEYIDGLQGATYLSSVNQIQLQYGSYTFFCDGIQWFVI